MEQRARRRCPASSRASRSRSATTCSRASRRSTARSSSRSSATTRRCCEQQDRGGPARRSRPCRGVARAFIDRAGEVPQLQIEIDRAARRALRPERRRHRGRHRDRARRQGGHRRSGRASGSSAWSSGCGEDERRDIDGDRARSCVDTPDGSRVPLAEVANIGVRQRQHEHQPRDRARASRPSASSSRAATWAASSSEMQRARRKQTSSCRRATSSTWGGEFENQQRAMARLRAHRADQHAADLRAAVQRLRVGASSAALILLNVPFALDRRHPGAVPHRHPPERLGGHRLHRAVRAGGAERRRDGQLLQPAAQRRASAPYRGGARRRAGAAADGADDRAAGDARPAADGAVARHRLGGAAAAGGGDHRRAGLGDAADADRAADALSPVERRPRAWPGPKRSIRSVRDRRVARRRPSKKRRQMVVGRRDPVSCAAARSPCPANADNK